MIPESISLSTCLRSCFAYLVKSLSIDGPVAEVVKEFACESSSHEVAGSNLHTTDETLNVETGLMVATSVEN